MIQNPKIVHDTIRVTKVIIDTVRAPSRDSMDMIYKMNAFYDSAWSKLIWVVGILLTIIGVVVPLVIQYWQNKRVKSSEKELKEDIKNAIAVATTDFTKYVDEQVKTKSDELNNKIIKNAKELEGRTYQLQGRILFDQNDHSSIESLFAAITSYSLSDQKKGIKKILNFILSEKFQLKTFTRAEVEKAFANSALDYKRVPKDVAQKTNDSEIKDLCNKLESIMDSLK